MQINPQSTRLVPHYSIGERLLRLSVFQIGTFKGIVERIALWVYNFFTKLKCSTALIDESRATKAVQSYERLKARFEFLTPADGLAKIHTMYLRAQDFNQKLASHGAKWSRIPLVNDEVKSIFAIIPPSNPSPDWKQFEASISMFKWKKRTVNIDNKNVEVIVTCENADSIEDQQCYKHLFLHCKSASVSFVMLGRRAGFYLGCKQDFCFFDFRGTWKSKGIASEAGYYNDAKVVFDKFSSGYEANKVWVSAACGGSPAAAYLKTQHPHLNLILESTFTNMKQDFTTQEGRLVKNLANRWWSALESRDIANKDKPIETGFNIEKLWKNLGQSELGKVILFRVTNDEILSPEVGEKCLKLAQSVSRQAYEIKFRSSLKKNPHSHRYFSDTDCKAQVAKIIFAT